MSRRIISILISLSLLFTQTGFAQVAAAELNLAGYLAKMGSSFVQDRFRPLHLRYFSYDALSDNFKVLLDKGDLKNLGNQELENSTKTLLSYFLIGVTLPNEAFWVNLRPDSADEIIDQELAFTDVGKIMLEADLQLKKDTARFTSPETPEGREYWNKLYKKAEEIYGYDNITIPTLTRPWIVPGEIIVRESQDSAYVYKALLKVMLEQDYLKDSVTYNFKDARAKALNEYSSQLIRELIIPKLTREVNSAKRYASVRQVYYSLILSRWFKNKFAGQNTGYAALINTRNLNGLTSKEDWSKTTYFKAYQKSFQDGEYNVKEPVYTPTGQVIRSYFSGGADLVKGMDIKTNPRLALLNRADSAAIPTVPNTAIFEFNGNGIKLGSSPIIINSLSDSEIKSLLQEHPSWKLPTVNGTGSFDLFFDREQGSFKLTLERKLRGVSEHSDVRNGTDTFTLIFDQKYTKAEYKTFRSYYGYTPDENTHHRASLPGQNILSISSKGKGTSYSDPMITLIKVTPKFLRELKKNKIDLTIDGTGLQFGSANNFGYTTIVKEIEFVAASPLDDNSEEVAAGSPLANLKVSIFQEKSKSLVHYTLSFDGEDPSGETLSSIHDFAKAQLEEIKTEYGDQGINTGSVSLIANHHVVLTLPFRFSSFSRDDRITKEIADKIINAWEKNRDANAAGSPMSSVKDSALKADTLDKEKRELEKILKKSQDPDTVKVAAHRLQTIESELPPLEKGGELKAGSPITLKKQQLGERIIVRFSEVGKNDVAIAGGKGANLGELQKVKGISVPDGVAITTKAFQLHIDKGLVVPKGFAQTITLREFISNRLSHLNYNDSEELALAGEDIRSAIESARMPQEVEVEIRKWYQQLCDEAGEQDLAVAIRSSATAEDLPDASFAGQQDTYLNISGIDAVLDATKRNWASLFTDRAIFYRHEQNIDHSTAYISVIIQRMANNKVSGTAFSVQTDTGFPAIAIDAAWGLGEGVVSGAANPDSFVVRKDGAERFRVYRRVFGKKLKKVVYREEGAINAKEGTELIDTSYEEQHSFCLSDEQIFTLAKAIEVIHSHYKRYMDIEWGFDAQGKLWILQARSETLWNKWEKDNPETVKIENTVVPEGAAGTAKILASGIASARAATGKVIIIDGKKEGGELTKELNRVQKGDILVTTMTKPDMVPAMKRASAIITDEGGPTCHAAIVARELGISCIVGTGKASKLLLEGQIITVDGNRGKVFTGALPIEELKDNVHIPGLPITKTKIGVIIASPFLAMRMWGFSKFISHYGVGLLRKEFADTTEILIHPLAGLAYDMYNDPEFKDEKQRLWIKKNIIDDKELREAIEDIMNGYPSFAEFFKDKLANTIALIAAAQTEGQRIKFRTTDFKTNEYKNQIGGPLFEPEEKNPMMGYRGINRMLSEAYKRAFELEIEAIKKARQNQKNIDVMFPVVRTPEELKEAIALLAKHGLVRGEGGFQIGMMVEVPANVFQAEAFYKYVDFMSIGSNDLTQFVLAIGRDNDKMRTFSNEANPAVKKALEVVIKTAKKMGVTSGFCGQRPSNDPPFAAFLVQAGIDSISVVPEVYKNVINVVAREEKKIEASEFDRSITGWQIPQGLGNPRTIFADKVESAEIIKKIGIHPQSLLHYYRGKTEDLDLNLKRIIERELAKKTAKEYVIGTVYEALMKKTLEKPIDEPIFYSTDDLDKTVYENLQGGQDLELFDENPQLGFCGLARVVDPEYQEFFRWQIEAIKKARQDSGRKNIGIRLNLARTLEDVKTAIKILEQEGLKPGEDGFMVGMEIAGPSNALLINEFIGLGINFISENNERFLSYDLALDPDSHYVHYSAREKREALDIPQRIWTTAAEEHGIPLVRFEGEMSIVPSNLPGLHNPSSREISPTSPMPSLLRSELELTDNPEVGEGQASSAVQASPFTSAQLLNLENELGIVEVDELRALGIKTFYLTMSYKLRLEVKGDKSTIIFTSESGDRLERVFDGDWFDSPFGNTMKELAKVVKGEESASSAVQANEKASSAISSVWTPGLLLRLAEVLAVKSYVAPPGILSTTFYLSDGYKLVTKLIDKKGTPLATEIILSNPEMLDGLRVTLGGHWISPNQNISELLLRLAQEVEKNPRASSAVQQAEPVNIMKMVMAEEKTKRGEAVVPAVVKDGKAIMRIILVGKNRGSLLFWLQFHDGIAYLDQSSGISRIISERLTIGSHTVTYDTSKDILTVETQDPYWKGYEYKAYVDSASLAGASTIDIAQAKKQLQKELEEQVKNKMWMYKSLTKKHMERILTQFEKFVESFIKQDEGGIKKYEHDYYPDDSTWANEMRYRIVISLSREYRNVVLVYDCISTHSKTLNETPLGRGTITIKDVFTTASSAVQIQEKSVGGIDFRTLPMTIQPMGSFTGLNFTLPKLSQADLAGINLDTEMSQLQNMVEKGIVPSGERIKEFIAACVQKGEINYRLDNLLLCLIDICKLEEENAFESSPELREALVIVDSTI